MVVSKRAHCSLNLLRFKCNAPSLSSEHSKSAILTCSFILVITQCAGICDFQQLIKTVVLCITSLEAILISNIAYCLWFIVKSEGSMMDHPSWELCIPLFTLFLILVTLVSRLELGLERAFHVRPGVKESLCHASETVWRGIWRWGVAGNIKGFWLLSFFQSRLCVCGSESPWLCRGHLCIRGIKSHWQGMVGFLKIWCVWGNCYFWNGAVYSHLHYNSSEGFEMQE